MRRTLIQDVLIGSPPERVVRMLTLTFVALLALHAVSVVSTYFYGVVIKPIDFNNEHNLPTLFATVELLICSYLLWRVGGDRAASGHRFRHHWRGLALVFLFLAVDESLRVHDRIEEGVAGGWVGYYVILLVVLGAVFLPFVASLPRKLAASFIVAGTVYVTGAVGMELVGVALKGMGYDNLHIYYRILITVEESLEFIGLILFIRALLLHVARCGAAARAAA